MCGWAARWTMLSARLSTRWLGIWSCRGRWTARSHRPVRRSRRWPRPVIPSLPSSWHRPFSPRRTTSLFVRRLSSGLVLAQGMRAASSRRCRSRCGTSRASGGTATSASRASKLRESPARTRSTSLLFPPLSKWRLVGCSVKRKVESESPLPETVSTSRRFLHAFLRSLGLFSTPSVFSSAFLHVVSHRRERIWRRRFSLLRSSTSWSGCSEGWSGATRRRARRGPRRRLCGASC